jgi:deoxyribonuclease V
MEPFPPPDSIGRDGVLSGGYHWKVYEAFAPPHNHQYIFVNVDRMKVGELHGLDLSPPEARRLQEELASRVVVGPALDLSRVGHVAGADVSTQGDMAYATVVVLEFPGLSLVEVQGSEALLRFPYVPGLLSFREVPSLVGALRMVETEVDALILDAQGLAHPRRIGLASHLGLYLDVPTVGCAKSRLVGSFEEPGREKGSATDLVHRGEIVGRVVRTRDGVSPVYVSVGNGIDLKSSVELVLACCTKYRLPESTRRAHNAANRLRRGEEPGGTMRLL